MNESAVAVLNNLIVQIKDILRNQYVELESFIDSIKKNPLRVANSKQLLDGSFYLEVYGEATNRNSQCAERRVELSKISIDIQSLLTQVKKAKLDYSLSNSYIQYLEDEDKKVKQYISILEIEQRKIDNVLRFYSTVQYVLSSPHYMK